MLHTANLYRVKLSIIFRQLYMPGVRGAAAIMLMNLVVILMMRIITRRMVRLAAEQADTLTKPARRGLAYVQIQK